MKRAIFGVDSTGRNVILHAGPLKRVGIENEEIAARSEVAGEAMYLAWAAKGTASGTYDYVSEIRDFNLQLAPGEIRFVRVEVAPGFESGMHRTPQINDYLIAVSGELTMFLEDGSSSKLLAGDMFVQLAGWHRWMNEGTVPFVMAGVIIGIATHEKVPHGVEFRSARL